MKQFYLAHATNSRHKIREWELKAEKNLNIDFLNPFYDMDRDDVKDWDAGVKNPRTKHFKDLVEDDLVMIREARDGLLAVLDENIAVGTLQEIIYAYIWGKEMHIIANEKYLKHPWVVYYSHQLFKSIN